MKGGDNMRFRDLLITSLLAGSAFILPNDAFAEKNEAAKNQEAKMPDSKKEAAISAKDNLLEKAVPNSAAIQPQTEIKANKPKVKKQIQLPEKNHKKIVNKELKSKKLSNVKANAKPIVDHAKASAEKKSKIAAGHKDRTNQTQLAKPINKQLTKASTKAALSSTEDNSQVSPPSLVNNEEHSKLETARVAQTVKNSEQVVLSASNLDHAEREKPIESVGTEDSDNRPLQQDKLPNEILGISTTQQSSKQGTAKDRTGLGQASPIEKWLQIEAQWDIQLINPYSSRTHVYHNQWVHAPPSPPPKHDFVSI